MYSAARRCTSTASCSCSSKDGTCGRPGSSAPISSASIRLTSPASGSRQASACCSEARRRSDMSSRLCYPIAILSLAVSTPVLAQQPAATHVDPRWTAWLGCWQQLEETVKDENVVEAGKHGAVPTKGVVVCVTPAGGAAVTLKTIIERQAGLEDTIDADGSNRAIDQ